MLTEMMNLVVNLAPSRVATMTVRKRICGRLQVECKLLNLKDACTRPADHFEVPVCLKLATGGRKKKPLKGLRWVGRYRDFAAGITRLALLAT